jgi:hypothetical protein
MLADDSFRVGEPDTFRLGVDTLLPAIGGDTFFSASGFSVSGFGATVSFGSSFESAATALTSAGTGCSAPWMSSFQSGKNFDFMSLVCWGRFYESVSA